MGSATSTSPTFTDRLGVERQTIAGIINDNSSLATTLANTSDPAKGAGVIPSVIRTVGVVSDMVSMTGWVVGHRVQTLGYLAVGDGGANDYTVISKGALVVDGGRYIATSNPALVFRGEFSSGRVHLSMYGVNRLGAVNITPQFLSARTKARELDVFLELGTGNLLLNSFTPANNDKMKGQGSAVTKLTFTTGNTGIHMSNKPYGVRHDVTPSYIKDTKFTGFTVVGTNVNIGIYAAANLFCYWDDVGSRESQVCNWFNAYIFGGKWGNIRADYGVGSGFEFGYNRFSWSPSVAGEPAALIHGASILRLDCYGNGTGLVARPALGSVSGAGAVFSDGLSNSVVLYYGEQNFGYGLVTRDDMAYSLGTVYLEYNDKFAPGGTDHYDYYNSAGQASVANLGPIFSNMSTVWNAGNLYCIDFRSTKIDGPGFTKISGNYRNATLTHPSVLSIPIVYARGASASLTKGYGIPRSMPPEGTRKFFRTGVYRVYPELIFESASTGIASARVIITRDSDSVEMYNQQVFTAGNPAVGVRLLFPETDFLWDNAQTYRLTFSGLATHAGEVSISLIADMMA